METIIWSRVSYISQDNERQISNLKKIAGEKGWNVKRVFEETVSGTIKTTERKKFNELLEYVEANGIKLILVSEISRIARRVVDILNTVDKFHKIGIGVYVQQFNMISLVDGKENPMVMMLLQMLSIGAELENSQRKIRQAEGIALAKLKNKYKGRQEGSRVNKDNMLSKYKDVVEMLKVDMHSNRSIARITKRSINTVSKVKKLLEAQ